MEHKSYDEDHRDAGDDVGMILDDEVMAQDWRILVRRSSLDSHSGNRLLVGSASDFLATCLRQGQLAVKICSGSAKCGEPVSVNRLFDLSRKTATFGNSISS